MLIVEEYDFSWTMTFLGLFLFTHVGYAIIQLPELIAAIYGIIVAKWLAILRIRTKLSNAEIKEVGIDTISTVKRDYPSDVDSKEYRTRVRGKLPLSYLLKVYFHVTILHLSKY